MTTPAVSRAGVRVLAGPKGRLARQEERLAQLRNDTARDRAESRIAATIASGQAAGAAAIRADRADAIVKSLGDKIAPTHAGAIRAAARESLEKAKAVADVVARSVGARIP
jgi:hypothetical protein